MLAEFLAATLLFAVPARGAPADPTEEAVQRIFKVLAFRREHKASAAEVALGRRLFFDPRLSSDGKMNCATCHMPGKHFADGRPTALGNDGKPVARNTPSLLNARYYAQLFWDGRAADIDEAALVAVSNPEEMAQPLPALTRKVGAIGEYASDFAAAYPGVPISSTTIGRALGAYVMTLTPPEDSPFDRFLADRKGLSEPARRGFVLFAGKARCIDCHTSPHLNYNGRYQNVGLKSPGKEDPGRYRVDGRAELWGSFRVSSLRNVAGTAPYMHDGSLPTLESVIDFYDRGGDNTRYQNPGIVPLGLSKREKADLVEFLRALTTSRGREP